MITALLTIVLILQDETRPDQVATPDAREGAHAMLEKRGANFEGR